MISRFAVSIGGRVFSAALQAAIFALLARALGIEAFGVFSLTFATSVFALSILDLGMGNRVLRGIRDEWERRALTTYTISRAALLITIPLIAGGVSSHFGSSTLISAVAAAYTVGESSGDVAVGIRQGERSSKSAMVILLTRRIGTLIPLVVWQTQQGALISMITAAALGVSAYAFVALRYLSRPIGLWRLIRDNFALLASGGASNLAQLDVAIVGSTLGATGAGFYGAGMRLFNPINLAINTMLQVLIPELAVSSSHEVRVQRFRRARKWVIVLSAFTAVGAIAAPALTTFLYGEEFEGAIPIAIAVFFAAAISGITQLHMSWFYAMGVPRIVPIGMWIAVSTGLICIWVFSSVFGLVGAAVGLITMHLLLAIVTIIPCQLAISRQGAA